MSAALALLAACSLLISACGTSAAKITNTPIASIAGKPASFDVVEIDQGNHRLYVADRTAQGVDVFDISAPTAKFLKTIALTSSPNGLAIAPDLARLYAGTANGSVSIVDINPVSPTGYTVVQEVATGGKSADLLDYGAARHEVYVSNGLDGTVTSIDANAGTVKAQFTIGFAVEQPRFNPADGLLYVASPDADAFFQVDPNDGKIKNRFGLGGCQPTGLAINPQSMVLIACRTSVLTWDLKTGNSVKFLQVTGGDVVTYSSKIGRFFVASPHKTGPGAVGMFGGNPLDFISAVAIQTGGNSAAYDETNDVVYTPHIQANSPGLASFGVSDRGAFGAPSLSSLALFGALLAVIVLLFVAVGRTADPARRVPMTPDEAWVRQRR